MKTCIFYIDEAGNSYSHNIPIIDGQTAIFTLASIAFSLDSWRDRDREYLRLKRYYFPDKMGHPTKRDEEIEIKGNEMTSPRNSRKKRNKAFLKGVLKYIRKYEGTTFGVTFLKNHSNPVPSRSIYTLGLQVLVERFQKFLEEHSEFSHGVIILDSRMSQIIGNRYDLEVARSHMSFIFGHQEGRTFDKIMESPLFVDSRLSVGIQVCDIFASLLFTNHYRYHAGNIKGAPNYTHTQDFWSNIKSLEFKNISEVKDVFSIYGYRVINHNRSLPSN